MIMTPPPSRASKLKVESVNPDGTWSGVTWVPAPYVVEERSDLNDRALGFIAMAVGLALIAVAVAFIAAGALS